MKRKALSLLLLMLGGLILAACSSEEPLGPIGDILRAINEKWLGLWFLKPDLEKYRRLTRILLILVPLATYKALQAASRQDTGGVIKWQILTFGAGFVGAVIPALTLVGSRLQPDDISLFSIAEAFGLTSPSIADIVNAPMLVGVILNVALIHRYVQAIMLLTYVVAIFATVIVGNTRPMNVWVAQVVGWLLFSWGFSMITFLVSGTPTLEVGPISTQTANIGLYAWVLGLTQLICYVILPVIALVFAPVTSFKEAEGQAVQAQEGRRRRSTLRSFDAAGVAGLRGVDVRRYRRTTTATATATTGPIPTGGPSQARLRDERSGQARLPPPGPMVPPAPSDKGSPSKDPPLGTKGKPGDRLGGLRDAKGGSRRGPVRGTPGSRATGPTGRYRGRRAGSRSLSRKEEETKVSLQFGSRLRRPTASASQGSAGGISDTRAPGRVRTGDQPGALRQPGVGRVSGSVSQPGSAWMADDSVDGQAGILRDPSARPEGFREESPGFAERMRRLPLRYFEVQDTAADIAAKINPQLRPAKWATGAIVHVTRSVDERRRTRQLRQSADVPMEENVARPVRAQRSQPRKRQGPSRYLREVSDV
ncbi:hypothetical protein IH980_01485 [Patescibacteria group bacterium]|nr:hypothetical protein [Patescibacteria group bacterium]